MSIHRLRRPPTLRLLVIALMPLMLAGCLEVEQHPPWREGQYNGKPDDMPQVRYYHNDRLSWNAAITNRNHLQNEYERTQP